MAFDPLPEALSDLCRRLGDAGGCGVELGCGDGELLRQLAAAGLWCWGVDRLPAFLAGGARVRGDALRPPLLDGALDLVIAGNLVRHLLPADPQAAFLAGWLRLLKPGGSVFILEDEPGDGPAERNHRDLQALLAHAGGMGRGPLISRDAFARSLPDALRGRIRDGGLAPNRWAQDPLAAAAMLDAGRPAAGSAAARLSAAIRKQGLACGTMWWLRLANA